MVDKAFTDTLETNQPVGVCRGHSSTFRSVVVQADKVAGFCCVAHLSSNESSRECCLGAGEKTPVPKVESCEAEDL